MDHRLIDVKEMGTMLLDRLELDDMDTKGDWQVILSTFCEEQHRYDEWIPFENPQQARAFIRAYSEGSAREFMERAGQWNDQRLAGSIVHNSR